MKNKFLNTTYSEFISENHTDYIIAYHGSDYIFDKFEKKRIKIRRVLTHLEKVFIS